MMDTQGATKGEPSDKTEVDGLGKNRLRLVLVRPVTPEEMEEINAILDDALMRIRKITHGTDRRA